MLGLRARQLRTLIATICVALSALLSAQFVGAAVDSVEHGLGVQHVASVVGGPVIYDHDDIDHHHEEPELSTSDDGGREPVSHHHHGDGPQMVILVGEADTGAPTSRAYTPPFGATPAPPSSQLGGLERPPRSGADRFA